MTGSSPAPRSCMCRFGTFEGERNGRFFTDMTMERLQERLEAAAGKYGGKGLHIVGSRVTGDVRPGRESEKWLNAILQKNGS